MPEAEFPLEDDLAALRAGYRQRIPGKLAEIDRAFRDWRESDRSDRRLDALITLVHRLAGSAASYGFPEMGLVARRFEGELRSARRALPVPPAPQGELENRLRELTSFSGLAEGGRG